MRAGMANRVSIALAMGLLCLSSNAWGFAVTGLSITKNAGNQADVEDDSGNPRSEFKSAVSITQSPNAALDLAGEMITFGTRYAAGAGLDRTSSGGSSSATWASDYRVSFTVEDPLNLGYDLQIDTERLGALTVVIDSGSAAITLGDVLGKLNSTTETDLGLGSTPAVASTSSDADVDVNQSNSFVSLGNVGTQAFTLDFTWDNGALVSNQSDTAIRLGIDCTLVALDACAYPGEGSRTAADDGHFVDVKVTLLNSPQGGGGPTALPEPGSVAMLGMGLLGLGVVRRRRNG